MQGKLLTGSIVGASVLSTFIHYLAVYGVLDHLLGTACDDPNNPDCYKYQKAWKAVSLKRSMFYTLIPVGYDKDGRLRFISIPRPVYANILTPLFEPIAKYAAIQYGTNILPEGVSKEQLKKEALSLGSIIQDMIPVITQIQDTLPGLSPIITLLMGYGQFIGGKEVIDPFTGKRIVSETTAKYAKLQGMPYMLDWTLQKTGINNYVSVMKIYQQLRLGQEDMAKTIFMNTLPGQVFKTLYPINKTSSLVQDVYETAKIKEEVVAKENKKIVATIDEVATDLIASGYKPTGKYDSIVDQIIDKVSMRIYGRPYDELDKDQKKKLSGMKNNARRTVVYYLYKRYGDSSAVSKPDKVFVFLQGLSTANTKGKTTVSYSYIKRIGDTELSYSEFRRFVKYAWELGLINKTDAKKLAEKDFPELRDILKW